MSVCRCDRERLWLKENLQTTDNFHNEVLIKRPYIKPEWLDLALANPVRREVQVDDGRIRYWVWIDEGRYLRVVTLEDGATVHNAQTVGFRHEDFI